MTERTPLEEADESYDTVCYLAGRDGVPLYGFWARPEDPAAAEKIAMALEHAAKQKNVRALENRTTNLKGVTRVSFTPDSGLRTTSDIVWSQDGLGELLTVSVYVDPAATLGNRVVSLEVPGGATSTVAAPSNTINVVTPQ